MVSIGYTIMSEQAGPKQLVADAVRAEDAGFDFVAASDHYFPWLDEQGHSPYSGRCSVRSRTRPSASSS